MVENKQDMGYRMDSGHRIQNTSNRMQDPGYRTQDMGYRIDSGHRIQNTAHRMQDTAYVE